MLRERTKVMSRLRNNSIRVDIALPDIFGYVDYRKYLSDVFEAIRAADSRFSYRGFARLAGSTSPNYYQLIMKGRIHPRNGHIRALGASLRLDTTRFAYFVDLIGLGRARTPAARERALVRLLRHSTGGQRRLISREQYDYFSTWYCSTVRAMVGYCRIPVSTTDFSAWSSQLTPSVSSEEFRQALDTLLALKLVQADTDGCFAQSDAVITTGDDVQSVQVVAFQREMTKLALNALEKCPTNHREISTLTMNISANGFSAIKERLRSFRKELMAIAATDTGDDRVYQLNLQMFPMTRISGDNQP